MYTMSSRSTPLSAMSTAPRALSSMKAMASGNTNSQWGDMM